jgi:hypothetical protein
MYEFQQPEKIVFLVATSDDGLVIGVFKSFEEIDEYIDSPTAFSLEHHD